MIVQAGGRGTRLGAESRNKPKCLVSVDGRPLIYTLFDRFPRARFIVIVDHLADVLEHYVDLVRPPVPVVLVKAEGRGTLAGLDAAAARLPTDDEPFLLVWSDLQLGALPDARIGNAVCLGLTASFPCRWSWSADGGLTETASDRTGVMGVFGIPGRRVLAGCPASGEFVEWLAASGALLEPVWIEDAVEIGTAAALSARRRSTPQPRYFNTVQIGTDAVVKQARDARFAPLIKAEARWYRAVDALGFPHVPRLVCDEPLTLARVPGRHPFDLTSDPRAQERVLAAIVAALGQLHRFETRPGSSLLTERMYREKPLARLHAVGRLCPDLTARDRLRVNGIACRNILHPAHRTWFDACVSGLVAQAFTPIHGDPTFSNILIDEAGKPWFIDPRGRFGTPSLHGDPRYDWAKLYYSVVGGYDRFNARRFELRLGCDTVDVALEPHGWEHLRPCLEDGFGPDRDAIRVIHALIWLSLSGFVLDDYDSIVAAYALGLYHLEAATA